jgi:hypothetical protein
MPIGRNVLTFFSAEMVRKKRALQAKENIQARKSASGRDLYLLIKPKLMLQI